MGIEQVMRPNSPSPQAHCLVAALACSGLTIVHAQHSDTNLSTMEAMQ